MKRGSSFALMTSLALLWACGDMQSDIRVAGGSDVGNPGAVTVGLTFQAAQSLNEAGGITLSNGLSIHQLQIHADEIRFTTCDGEDVFKVEGRWSIDLLNSSIDPKIDLSSLPNGHYCSASIQLAIPAFDPASILIQGLYGRIEFELRSSLVERLEVVQEDLLVKNSEDNLDLAFIFDLETWFQGIDLSKLLLTRESRMLIDETNNTSALRIFEKNLKPSMRMRSKHR